MSTISVYISPDNALRPTWTGSTLVTTFAGVRGDPDADVLMSRHDYEVNGRINLAAYFIRNGTRRINEINGWAVRKTNKRPEMNEEQQKRYATVKKGDRYGWDSTVNGKARTHDERESIFMSNHADGRYIQF